MTLKFNRVPEVVKVHVRAKSHQAKYSGYIYSALDFGQLQILIVSNWVRGRVLATLVIDDVFLTRQTSTHVTE